MQPALEIRSTLKPFRGARSNPNHLFNIAQSQYFRPSLVFRYVPVRSKILAFVKRCSLAEKYTFRSLSTEKLKNVPCSKHLKQPRGKIKNIGRSALSRHGPLLISFIWCKSVNLIIMTRPTFTTMMSTGLKMQVHGGKFRFNIFRVGSHSGLVKHYN